MAHPLEPRRIRSLDPQRRVISYSDNSTGDSFEYFETTAPARDDIEAFRYRMDGGLEQQREPPDTSQTLTDTFSQFLYGSDHFEPSEHYTPKPASILLSPKKLRILSPDYKRRRVRWKDMERQYTVTEEPNTDIPEVSGCTNTQELIKVLDEAFREVCLGQEPQTRRPPVPPPHNIVFEEKEGDLGMRKSRKSYDPIMNFRRKKLADMNKGLSQTQNDRYNEMSLSAWHSYSSEEESREADNFDEKYRIGPKPENQTTRFTTGRISPPDLDSNHNVAYYPRQEKQFRGHADSISPRRTQSACNGELVAKSQERNGKWSGIRRLGRKARRKEVDRE